jgi:hypothetical protein
MFHDMFVYSTEDPTPWTNTTMFKDGKNVQRDGRQSTEWGKEKASKAKEPVMRGGLLL